MPRRIDLTKLPPEQTACYACRRVVTLDRRARRAGKFRCPFCHSDNRVATDGRTSPVAGLAEPIGSMPQVRCVACGQTNRLPRRLLRGARFTCWSCGALERVPRTLRRRAGLTSRRVLGGAALGLFLILSWAGLRIATAIGRYGTPWDNQAHAGLLDRRENVVLVGAESLAPTAEGARYQATLEIYNSVRQPVSYHVTVRVMNDDQLVVSRTVSALRLAPGETRRLKVLLVDQSRRPADSLRVELTGIS